MQIIAANKKAFHDYLIGDRFEAGLVLTGPEVKSLRINTGSIKESYIIEKDGELWSTNCHIKKYSSSKDVENSTTRERKILVKKKELNKIIVWCGYTKIKDSLSIYLNQRVIEANKVPVNIGKQIDNAKPWFEPKRILPNNHINTTK